MKRILFFDNSLDGQVGGSHHSLLLLVKHLNSSTYEKVVVLNSDNALRGEFEKYCKKVIVWNGPSAAAFEGLGTKKDWNSKFRFRPLWMSRLLNFFLRKTAIVLNDVVLGAFVVFRYFALLKREDIGLVHLNNWFDPYWILAAKLARIPVIQHTRGIAPSNYYPFCHWVNRVICISKDVRKRLIQRGIERNKTVLIYNAVDPKEFRWKKHAEAVRSELGIEDSYPVVAIFGNIKRWKGQDLAIKACGQLREKFPSIKCVLFGESREDDYFAEIKESAMAGEMNGLVVFAGYRADVADCMNAADIIVHASTSPEPFGRVIIEAMTLGKSIIGSNAGAVPEIIENNISGLLFEPGNIEELVQKMEFILQHPDDALKFGHNAFQRVQKDFTIEKQIDLIEEIYESVS